MLKASADLRAAGAAQFNTTALMAPSAANSIYARKSVRLNEALELIGWLLGGEAGARATRKLAMANKAQGRQFEIESTVMERMKAIGSVRFSRRSLI
jgi:hypothetical protein